MDNKCIFCKIVKGDIPANKVYEDNNFLAFMDINPINKGHILVIPKIHYPTVVDIPQSLIGKYYEIIQKITTALQDGTGNKRFNWFVMGEDVAHAHHHIVPRIDGDNAITLKHHSYDSDDELKEFQEKISKNID